MSMSIQSLYIGMEVRHPQYGVGVVKALTELTADISFDNARRTIAPASSELIPAEPTAAVSELQVPLSNLKKDRNAAIPPDKKGNDGKAGLSLRLRVRKGDDGKVKISWDPFRKALKKKK